MCGILVPQVEIEPMHPAVEAWSLNHWTTRKVPYYLFFCPASFQESETITFHFGEMYLHLGKIFLVLW